jgi:lipoate-protein ligase B
VLATSPVTREVRLLDLGRRSYGDVLALQRELHEAVAADAPETWIVVEHDPVITLGRNAKDEHLLLSRERLAARGIEVHRIERGGDVTYHGPGQVVVYPIRKLERFREVSPLVGALESAVIAALAGFGIEARRHAEHRGVYVGRNAICAVGLAVRSMTSLHGLALNVCTELDYDRLITPCGTPQFGITSIARELGRNVGWHEGRDALLAALERTFAVRFDAAKAEPLASESGNPLVETPA